MRASERGHELAYVVDSGDHPEFNSQLSVLRFEEAAGSRWDGVLVPGAGFPPDTIKRFARFRDRRFGVRVQMVLNDQKVRSRFLAVNAAFDPDIVIFNSEAWPPGSYRDFSAMRFHHLIGAVDVIAFRFRAWSPAPDRFVVGAQISKILASYWKRWSTCLLNSSSGFWRRPPEHLAKGEGPIRFSRRLRRGNLRRCARRLLSRS